jgi:vacuolar-type H+-ATPase subunit H
MYIRGASKSKETQIARSINTMQKRRADLTRKLGGVTDEVQALRRAHDTIKAAEKQAVTLCNQAITESNDLKNQARTEAYATVDDAQTEAGRIIMRAERDARAIREQAYDFGLAQLDRDYPTREARNRERTRAKNTLVKHYGRARLAAATAEAAQWDRTHQEADAA